MSEPQRFRLISELVRHNAANAVMVAPDGFEVIIQEAKNSRSLAQNRLFHMWMREISQGWAEATGEFHAPDVWKEYFKRLYLGQETIRGMSVTRHTSKLKVTEMAEFLTWIDHYVGSELGVTLTHPVDLYMESMGR